MNKYFRYLISGYVFKRKSMIQRLHEPNHFSTTDKEFTLPRVAIYTVSTGKYDSLREPAYVDKNFDYYAFSSIEISKKSLWKQIEIGINGEDMSSLEQARYVKTHPHLYFKDYDISIFIDGNIQILCDIRPLIFTMIDQKKIIAIHRHTHWDCLYDEGKIVWAQGRAKWSDIYKQLRTYKKEGFPKHYGLFETNVIIRFHNEKKCKDIMETWWSQIDKYTKRDQLSFTYSLWKNGVDSNFVLSLGNCSRNSNYFSVVNHNK